MPAFVNEVVATQIDDKPGQLSAMLEPLKEANVSVAYMYAFAAGVTSNKAVMVFRFSDNDKAIEVLQKNGIKILDAEAFGILENEG
ncbi:MAG: hypothetical protein GY859_00355 [Desulfobacterales bacterium]|nr:hypothetical protein [Desulfobacterales bacterium]